MSSKKFRFVSPGVFLNEIDNSALPVEAAAQGPVIIGRTARGPGLRPVVVQSYSEFVEVFGNPVAGNEGGDIWRKVTQLAQLMLHTPLKHGSEPV